VLITFKAAQPHWIGSYTAYVARVMTRYRYVLFDIFVILWVFIMYSKDMLRGKVVLQSFSRFHLIQ
jgi:hypothetical protein